MEHFTTRVFSIYSIRTLFTIFTSMVAFRHLVVRFFNQEGAEHVSKKNVELTLFIGDFTPLPFNCIAFTWSFLIK